MQVKDIMKTDVKCADGADTLQDVARLMADENIGFVPVCKSDQHDVGGTVTDRDIVIRGVAEGKAPNTPISEVMSGDVLVYCKPEDDVGEIHKLMEKHKKSRVLVLDDEGAIAGVVSLSDLAQRTEDAGQAIRQITSREHRPN